MVATSNYQLAKLHSNRIRGKVATDIKINFVFEKRLDKQGNMLKVKRMTKQQYDWLALHQQ